MRLDRLCRIALAVTVLACHTHPEPSDAGVSTPPSATPPAPPTATATATVTASAAQGCHADAECVSATCCGPFGADEPCVPRATVQCAGIACPQMLASFACACRAGKCVTTRIRKDADLGSLGRP